MLAVPPPRPRWWGNIVGGFAATNVGGGGGGGQRTAKSRARRGDTGHVAKDICAGGDALHEQEEGGHSKSKHDSTDLSQA